MIDRRSRRFTIGDAMILVAAFAMALAQHLARAQPHYQKLSNWIPIRVPGGSWSSSYGYIGWIDIAHEAWWRAAMVIPDLTMATLAILAIRLRRPRPDLRRLYRQPGAVAVSAAVVVIFWDVIGLLVQFSLSESNQSQLNERPYYANSAFAWAFLETPETIGLAVGVSWVLLALGGRWRAERGWIDRAGRVIGVAWLVLVMLDWSVHRIQ